MTFSEKTLYHQIHPLKLGTDIVFAIVSLYFFWHHELALALALHFLPPILASALVIGFFDLDAQRRSSFGRYVQSMMTRKIEGIRLAGDLISVVAAWYHSWPMVAVGLLVVLGAWLSGVPNKYLHKDEK